MKKLRLLLSIAVVAAFATAIVDYTTGVTDALNGIAGVNIIIHKLAYTMNGALLYWTIEQ